MKHHKRLLLIVISLGYVFFEGLFQDIILNKQQSKIVYATDQPPSFYPIWKLLNLEQKQQFVAGYLHGWRDAALVTDIAIQYVRKNPQKAVSSLEGVKELYNLRSVRSADLVEKIDEFYSDPENLSAPLSRAVTSARALLR